MYLLLEATVRVIEQELCLPKVSEEVSNFLGEELGLYPHSQPPGDSGTRPRNEDEPGKESGCVAL
jgi:hypothetical protein